MGLKRKTRIVVPTCATEELMLDFLVAETGLSRADVVRRLIRESFGEKTSDSISLIHNKELWRIAVAANRSWLADFKRKRG